MISKETRDSGIMSNPAFKEKARKHQIKFRKDPEIGIPAMEETPAAKANYQKVKSSLLWKDAKDDYGFRIFYSGFRKEITRQVYSDRKTRDFKIGPMVTNLLRSEHIPYNVFFPMTWDKEGAVNLFNDILKTNRIQSVNKIVIEYNPGTLADGTAFDVFIEYNTTDNKVGGIGVEIKYTEKEYPLKVKDKEGKFTKEYKETHDITTGDIRLADNYMIPSQQSGWFTSDAIKNVEASQIKDIVGHVVQNRYRQIWRNHLLGASMMLPNDKGVHLDEFTSLTVYPNGNGHFSQDLWNDYGLLLTEAGKTTLRHITYEELFPKMRTYLRGVKDVDNWIDYLERRYLISDKSESR